MTKIHFTENKNLVISGYAAVFNKWSYDLGGYREMILPGSIDLSIDPDIVACWNHSPNTLLGRMSSGTLEIKLDGHGLYYEISPGSTAATRNIIELINRGDIRESSFAMTLDRDKWLPPTRPDGPYRRKIIKVKKIYDVSPVTYPSYPQTTASISVKNRPDTKDQSCEKQENPKILESKEILKNSNSQSNISEHESFYNETEKPIWDLMWISLFREAHRFKLIQTGKDLEKYIKKPNDLVNDCKSKTWGKQMRFLAKILAPRKELWKAKYLDFNHLGNIIFNFNINDLLQNVNR